MDEENNEVIVEVNEVIEEVNEEVIVDVEPDSILEKVASLQSEEPATLAEEAIAAYEADFNYKVYDEVREIPEDMRGFITNKETEDKFREIYGKSGAFDSVKEKYNGLKERVDNHYSKVEADHNNLNQNLDDLSAMVQNDDMHGFFKALGVSEDKIMKYALNRAEYQEMEPQQKAQVDHQYNQTWESAQLAKQNHAMQEQIQYQEVQTRELLLDSELAKNADFVTRFDEQLGQGAFRQEVINAGQLAYQQRQQDVLPTELVSNLMDRYGNLFATQAQQAPAATAPATNNQVVAPAKSHPTIPNVKGGSTSPAQKIPTSLADLQRMADSME